MSNKNPNNGNQNPNSPTDDPENPSISFEQLREFKEEMLSQLDGRASAHASLTPVSPEQALKKYLETRAGDVQTTTLRSHESRLGKFVDWCGDQGIETLDELGGSHLVDFRNWRRDDGDLGRVSLKTQMDTLRVFVRFCATIDAVPDGLHESVLSPVLSRDEESRDVLVSHEQASQVLAHLRKYQYASREHVVWMLLGSTGMRTGALRSLDLDDYDPDDLSLDVNHRPETDTPLKNGKDGERLVSIDESVAEVLNDYVADKRPEVVDDYGRDPLVATTAGRIAPSTIRKYVYKWTRPCVLSGECPIDNDPETCPAACSSDKASKCDLSRSPHTVRRGYITHQLDTGVPPFVLSGRCDVTEDVMDQHYDVRTEDQKMRQRREVLERLAELEEQYGHPTEEEDER
ncbi:tyrosine-type recombinase/integrase (plasmid) [Salinirubellus salinus]|uniref:Tyrosine-type recombinase/integrase n=1 Tax=Salinirubellus salinus TaxID=1364945 RepID=A0A9E7R7G6_9EURY|nr:site-specific integrase [Salinirubellus salinus]UWM56947.1 tyrosine-type recombinase/integrase [Salinirubellus salinus]